MIKYLAPVFIFLLLIPLFSFSQTTDSLKNIFSSSSFSLNEEYSGDWGSSSHTFLFTKRDTGEEVLWQDPDFPDGEEPRELKIVLTNDQMQQLEKLFSDCLQKIHHSKKGSTEQSLYIFKNKDLNYTIDDNTTMQCADDFKEWKQNLFQEGLKQEKNKSKK